MKVKLDSQLIAIVCLVAVGLLIGAAGYFTMVAPQRSKVAKVHDEIANAQTELVVAQGAAARPVPFHASDLFRLANAMPTRTDMPGIILALRHLAGRSSVQLTSVRPSAPVPLALGYSAVPVGVTINGTYAQITKFVGLVHRDVRFAGEQLDVGGRLFDTDVVQLQASTNTAQQGIASATGQTTTGGTASTTTGKGKGKHKVKGAIPTPLSAVLSMDAFIYTGVVIAPTPPAGTSTDGTTTTTTTTATTTTSGS